MKRVQMLVFITVSLFLASCSINETHTPVQDGIYTYNGFPDTGFEKLNGEWEFYWKALLDPEDFKNSHLSSPEFVKVPGTWRMYEAAGGEVSKQGYATYRIHLSFDEQEIGTAKALFIQGGASSYKIWIAGKAEAENGKVGTGKSTTEPSNSRKLIYFEVSDEKMELVMQVANFHQRKSGIYNPVLLGEPEAVAEYREKNLLFRAMIVMSLLVMGLYHIILFVLRKKEVSLIFFSMVCLLVAARAALLDGVLASYLFPFLNWDWEQKLEYLGASMGVLFFALYTYSMFPKDMAKTAKHMIICVMGAYSLLVIVAPPMVFTSTMRFLQVLILLVFIYLIYVDVKALYQKREGSLLNITAILLFFMTIVNDIMLYNHWITSIELTSVGLTCFLFVQSIIISRHYASSFRHTERLSRELASFNASLERQVRDRTMELRQAISDLQLANQKLREAHQSRSKWIRNIYHEIAAPLTTIRAYTKGILDGVIQRDMKFIRLIHEQSLYLSRMLNDLHDMTEIENREITFNRKKVNVLEYVQELYHKHKVDIEKQGIHFCLKNSLAADEDVFILIDKHRIEQVMVNFLNNAQKFIGDGGMIRLDVEKEEHQVVIKVTDNGIGISKKDINLVFNRFFKGETPDGTSIGSGLGLAISKEIIDYHGGTIGTTSEEGKGSCFYFKLPIAATVSRARGML
ncbi:7TM diverse intracellular signaling domain-containing protein [Siminovitchia sediminis]|uniref:histidine kinase n=1 Tax=Siminovitchia sediminis TaxID=1274353 RepID=A0ABW4KB43_9BACI